MKPCRLTNVLSRSAMKRSAQRIVAVARRGLCHTRCLWRHIKSMECSGIDMKLHGHAGACEAPSIIQILFEKEIECADADKGFRQALEIAGARCGCVWRDPRAAGRGSEQARPAEPAVGRSPDIFPDIAMQVGGGSRAIIDHRVN